MPAIGITGGISTGKTTFTTFLSEILPEAKIFNADSSARSLAESDPDVRGEISREFGSEIYSGKGLNRERLRSIVFADAGRRRALEAILHPRIRRQWSDLARSYRESLDFFFADIPLLYETAGESLCNWVVVVVCSEAIQLERLTARSRFPAERAQEMIKAQMDLKEKMKRAKHVVWNNGPTNVLRRQTETLVNLWQSQGTIS